MIQCTGILFIFVNIFGYSFICTVICKAVEGTRHNIFLGFSTKSGKNLKMEVDEIINASS